MKVGFRYLYSLLCGALMPSLRTTLWLLRIMIPISLAVRLLQYFGVIAWIAQYLNPLFQNLGLPGASAIAFLTAASVTTYAGLAVMLSMQLTLRQATILAIMACLCHALPLESAVLRKVGSNPFKMAMLRIAAAFVAALLLNLVLPEMPQTFISDPIPEGEMTLRGVLTLWVWSSLRLSAMIYGIILGLMFLQRVLDDLGIMYMLVRPLQPLMRFFGLPANSAYLWLVGNVLGISYGSAMMIELEESGQITPEEANEVNYHLVMNHSMLEDTLVYAAAGVSAFWILSTRILFALIVVWGRKILKFYVRKVFSVKNTVYLQQNK